MSSKYIPLLFFAALLGISSLVYAAQEKKLDGKFSIHEYEQACPPENALYYSGSQWWASGTEDLDYAVAPFKAIKWASDTYYPKPHAKSTVVFLQAQIIADVTSTDEHGVLRLEPPHVVCIYKTDIWDDIIIMQPRLIGRFYIKLDPSPAAWKHHLKQEEENLNEWRCTKKSSECKFISGVFR